MGINDFIKDSNDTLFGRLFMKEVYAYSCANHLQKRGYLVAQRICKSTKDYIIWYKDNDGSMLLFFADFISEQPITALHCPFFNNCPNK